LKRFPPEFAGTINNGVGISAARGRKQQGTLRTFVLIDGDNGPGVNDVVGGDGVGAFGNKECGTV
jgi:hypothetical protein